MHLLKISKNLRDTTSKLFLNGGMISYIKTYILNNGYISSDKYIYEPQKSGGMAPFIPRSLTMAHCDAPFAMGFAMVSLRNMSFVFWMILGSPNLACQSNWMLFRLKALMFFCGKPSGKHTKIYGTSPFSMGKSTINGSFHHNH